MSTIPSVDLGMAAFSGIASANISIAVPVLSQNLCHVAIPDSRTGADCVWRLTVGALTPTFPTRLPEWGDRAVWEDLHHRDPYTRTRSGWINGWKRMFYLDTHFVL